ncbi:MAG: TrkH family potassium uptake protein [Geitlerinemataceae cyanobacterium]
MQYRQYLRQRYRIILGAISLIAAIVGVTILLPLLALVAYPEELGLAWAFLLPGVVLLILGLLLWRRCTLEGASSLTLQEGAVIVVVAWLLAIAVSTVPLMAIQGLNFTQAVFESTSGWTTTGLSVVDVTQASKLILLFRSIMEFAGGAGLAILTLSTIAGSASSGLSAAEGRTEQLAPNVRRSAKLVMAIYSGYAAVGTVALRIAGMGWFDAINHSFAALSTGGFSTRPDSIGYWDSPAVEIVTIVLMILGTLNFLTSYFLLKGNFPAVIRNGEVRLQALLIPTCIVVLMLGVANELYPTSGKSLRVAAFESISALSTTGFSTVGYGDWNGLGWLVLIILMLIGGGTGATAGGLKQFRVYYLYRALRSEISRLLLPKSAISEAEVWQGERRVFLSDEQIRQVSLFIFLYFAIYATGSAITAGYGYSLQESLFEYASTLGTVGLSVGVTAADAPVGLLWTQIVGMFLGRLEFFAVVVGLVRLFKDALPLLF